MGRLIRAVLKAMSHLMRDMSHLVKRDNPRGQRDNRLPPKGGRAACVSVADCLPALPEEFRSRDNEARQNAPISGLVAGVAQVLVTGVAIATFMGRLARQPVRVTVAEAAQLGLVLDPEAPPLGLKVTGEQILATRHSPPAVSFFAPGTPAPQGSKDPFRNQFTGKIHQVEQSKRAKPWRQDVQEAGEKAMAGRPPLSGPLSVQLRFVFMWRQGDRNAKGEVKPGASPLPLSVADIDKLERAVLDAMQLRTGGIVIVDDKLVVDLHSTKEYGERPGVHVAVRQLA